jgi:hypothetical protein
MKQKLLETPGYVFGRSNRQWPAPGKWPEMQPCGEKAKCRDCKKVWTLKSFNNLGKPRKDGTQKKLPFCVYCQSKLNLKHRLIRMHRQREEARRSA